MPPIHLSEFEMNCLTYCEHERRFSLQLEVGTRIRAYNIDVSGSGNQYFKSLYANNRAQGRRSADGIYVGSCHKDGRQIHFVIVVELEGHSTFEEAVGQVKATLDHFCRDSIDACLEDDGQRHHIQATQTPRPYLFQANLYCYRACYRLYRKARQPYAAQGMADYLSQLKTTGAR